MAHLMVRGGAQLSGEVSVDGNKNAALPLLAACVLTPDTCELRNVPQIRDVAVMIALLRSLGAKVEGEGTSTLRVTCAEVPSGSPDAALVGRLRGSVMLMGSLLARVGWATLAVPGGDFPARRSIATHLRALHALGARAIDHAADDHRLEARSGLKAVSMYLPEASVTGTETALMAAAAADGTSEFRHSACEPHVVELCDMLTAMGAPVEGMGTSTLRITGSRALKGVVHTLRGDYIEAASWGVVAAVTGGNVVVRGAKALDMEPTVSVLCEMGLDCDLRNDEFVVRPSELRATRRIATGLWPAFPSDIVSLVTVMATQAQGATLLHDWMYELRLFALEQLSAMGADMFLCDSHRIIVTGKTPLRGRRLDSRDIRSGMALIAAALAAQGESKVLEIETVERGYADLVNRLRGLGADVERLE